LRPLARTAAGRALLSTYNDNHIVKLLRRINAERAAHENPISIQEFLGVLKVETRRGYFAGDGTVAGQAGLAATVDTRRQLLVIAIEGGSAEILEKERSLSLLLGHAASAALLPKDIAMSA
jgi:DNA-binding IclR family transcriptional regulator